jgi:hypothetical protein
MLCINLAVLAKHFVSSHNCERKDINEYEAFYGLGRHYCWNWIRYVNRSGLFHSKNGLQRIQAKFAESFSLSHVGELIGAIEIEREVTSDGEDLR